MAFVLDITKRVGTEGVPGTSVQFEDWFTADDGLVAGDYIMVCASNGGGIAALTLTSTTGTWERLDNIDSPRVGVNMRSQIWWHKYDGTTLPSAPTTGGGSSSSWVAFAWVVRDAPNVSDQSWIDVNARTDTSTQTRVHTIGSVTTTEPDCLLLTVYTSTGQSGFETPDNFWGVDLSVGRTGDNELVVNPPQHIIVASRAQFTAGATPTYDYVNGLTAGVRAQHWTIAIKNKSGGTRPIGIQNPPTRIFDYFDNNNFTTAASVLTDLSTVHATIDGQSTFAPATIGNVVTVAGVITNNPPILDWFRQITIAPPTATTGVSGVRWNLPAATDFTTGLWCLFFRRSSTPSDSVLGVYHYFEDSSGNWAVYQFLTRPQGALYNTIIRHLPDETAVDGSVTPVDLTDVTKRGIAYQQTASNTAGRSFQLRAECIQSFTAPLTLVGGGPANPITARTVARMLQTGAAWNLAFTQGQGQQVITMPYQLGDGTVATYVDDEAQALEYPRVGGVLGYTVLENRQEIRVKASASDIISLSAGVKGTTREQNFVIDPSSSSSATYGFAGAFIGWKVTAKTGINVSGATFIDCDEIDAKGAQFNNCIIKSTTSTDAAIAFDANSSMTGTTIDVTGTNAAFHLELGASVTAFTLTDVTFVGTPGTDKVNVKATSGTVEITLSNTTLAAGDITSAGATVVINQPQSEATVTCLDAATNLPIQGARVLLRTDAGATVLSGLTDASGKISEVWAGGNAIVSGWARKASGSPNYIQGALAGTITASGFSATVLMQAEG